MADGSMVPMVIGLMLMVVTAWWLTPYPSQDWNAESEEILQKGLLQLLNSPMGTKQGSDQVTRQGSDQGTRQGTRQGSGQDTGQINFVDSTVVSGPGHYVLEPKDNIVEDASDWKVIPCEVCKIVVDLIHDLVQQKRSKHDIISEVNKLCVKLRLFTPRVCNGTVNLFSAEVLTVVESVALTSHQICGLIFGDACANIYDPFLLWNVTLPEVPKPPVKPPTPPKPGLPKLRILHLSDIHLDLQYKVGSNAQCREPLCCRGNDGPLRGKPAGRWGDYRYCDTPSWTLENLFQHLAANQTFDMIYWTGDLPGHNIWNQTREDQIQILEFVFELFQKYLPSVPMYPSLGNHESSPVDSFPPPYVRGTNSISWLYNRLLTNWSIWLPIEAHSTINKGAYYSVLLWPGFRLISLNTNYCNQRNWWMLINMTDPAGELAWLISELQHAEDYHEKVHIIGHIPPGDSTCLPAWSWNYYTIVNRYESIIMGQFFGHTHHDHYEVFYDPESNFTRATSIAYIGPSVTTYSHLNPGYRIYEVDGFHDNSSWTVLDHHTYIMNLTDANNSGKPRWNLEYSAKTAYNLESLFPSDWDKLIRQFKDNEQLFQKFYRYYYKSNPLVPCGPLCKAGKLCDLLSARTGDAYLCNRIQHGYEYSRTHRYLDRKC